MPESLKSLNLAITFAVELAAIVGFGFWGYSLGRTPLTRWLLAIAFMAVIILVWATFFAPTADHRLAAPTGVLLSTLIFLLGSLGFYLAGKPTLALILAIVTLLNRLLAWIWAQW